MKNRNLRRDSYICTEIAVFVLNLSDIIFLRTAPHSRGPVINQAQFIRAVADNMKQRLFTTVSNRTQASVVATHQEMYENLVSQVATLNPCNWVHENPLFGENEVKVFVRPFI